MLDILIVMNNYFHDVATAVLLSSAVILWLLSGRARKAGGDALAALRSAYPTLTRFALGAFAWIVVGGVPRTIFFNTHEFIPAKVKHLVPGLVVKHTLMFTAVVVGILIWREARTLLAEEARAEKSRAA